jgi:D-alanine-D-alanine ligase
LGHTVDRIGGVKSLSARLTAGDRWDLVFNYAEGMFGFAREAQVPSLLDAFQIPYTLSDGLVFALTLHKGMTKHVVRSLGIRTPEFSVVSSMSDVATVRLPYPLFVKPVAGGSASVYPPHRTSRMRRRSQPRVAPCSTGIGNPPWSRPFSPAANSPSALSAPALAPASSASSRSR